MKKAKSRKVNPVKMAVLQGRIDRVDVFFDTYELDEMAVCDALAEVGIYTTLTEAEAECVKEYLKAKVAQEEIAEAARWAISDSDPLWIGVPNRGMPSPKSCERFHQRWKKTVEHRQGKVQAEHLLAGAYCEMI